MNEFEDIEQMLKPQCEFKASETLKEEVMTQAREEVKPHRPLRLWPWLAAACVAGVAMLLLTPPKRDESQLIAAYRHHRMARSPYVCTLDETCKPATFEDYEKVMKGRCNQLMSEIEIKETNKINE